MKCTLDCLHCYLKQAISCMSSGGIAEAEQYPVLYELMQTLIPTLDPMDTPADNSTRVLKRCMERLGQVDPYAAAKDASNALALMLYPRLKAIVAESPDPVAMALRVSVAGNVIDLGIQRDFDIEASLSTGFARDESAAFRTRLATAGALYFLCDNAGEIVFDRVLLETLAEARAAAGRPLPIVAVVKGGPILNDATRADADAAGLACVPGLCVVDSGCDWVGTPFPHIRPELRAELLRADLILAKGQGNFETLEHEAALHGRCFMLMKAKCESVARAAGVQLGNWVFTTQ